MVLRPLQTRGDFFARFFRTSIIFFEPVYSQYKLAHQRRTFAERYCGFYFFESRSIFWKFRFRGEHIWPIKMHDADVSSCFVVIWPVCGEPRDTVYEWISCSHTNVTYLRHTAAAAPVNRLSLNRSSASSSSVLAVSFFKLAQLLA